MRLSEYLASIVARLTGPPPPPSRPMSTPEDVRWKRLQLESLRREADMLEIDSRFEQAESQ